MRQERSADWTQKSSMWPFNFTHRKMRHHHRPVGGTYVLENVITDNMRVGCNWRSRDKTSHPAIH